VVAGGVGEADPGVVALGGTVVAGAVVVVAVGVVVAGVVVAGVVVAGVVVGSGALDVVVVCTRADAGTLMPAKVCV
jgi:hypothetical protein